VVILAGLVVGAWLVDEDHERDQSHPVDATTPLEAQGFLPVSAPEDALTSTWYCGGGTATDGGRADTTIVVANATDRELSGTLTIFPSIPSQIVLQADPAETPDTTTTTTAPPPTTTGSDGDTATTTTAPTPSTTTTAPSLTERPVAVDLEVPAQDRVEVRLADEVDAEYAAALVELAGGAVSVEQRVDGPNGADVSPCTSQAADSWYFADGRTTADSIETLAFFNPFPDPAVVDVTFRTEEDLRTPVEFEAYAVPAQSLVVEDIGTLVTRREHVSVSVVARSGRLVVSRLLDVDGSEGPRGLDIASGAPQRATTWYFPDGIVEEGLRETYVVYNPGDTAAEVDLYIEPDEVDRFGAIEPFGLTIPPEGFQEVAVQDEERIGTAIGAAEGEPVLRHGARVVSVNDVPVVVERVLEGDDGSDRPGFDLMFGAPLLMEQAVLAASSTEESVVVANPSGSTPVRVTFRSLDGGTLGEAPTATDLEVRPAGRLVVNLDELGLGSDVALLVEADGPVTIERRVVIGDPSDSSGAIAVPLAGAVSEPPSPFG
jgi:hypothetical protein